MMSLSVLTALDTVVDGSDKMRIALIVHLGRLDLFPVHDRALRHLRQEHRFHSLRRTRYRREHARSLVLEGIRLKSSGSASVANFQGPDKAGAENQRPDKGSRTRRSTPL